MKKTRALIGLFLLVLVVSILLPLVPTQHASAATTFNYDPGVAGSPPGILINDSGSNVELFQVPGLSTHYVSTVGNCQVEIDVTAKNSNSGHLAITDSSNPSKTGSVNDCQFNSVLPSFASLYPNLSTPYPINNIGGEVVKTGAWLDHSEILFNVNGKDYTFRDDKIDDTLIFNIKDTTDKCISQDRIDGFHLPGANVGNATSTVNITLFSPSGSSCASQTFHINFTAPNNYNSYFSWQDASTIKTSDLTGIIFVQSNGTGPFVDNGSGRSGNTTCKSRIEVSGTGALSGKLILSYPDQSHVLFEGWPGNNVHGMPNISSAPLKADGSGCYVTDPLTVPVANPGQNSQKAAGSSLLAASSSDPNANPSLSCENKLGTGNIFDVGAQIGKGINWLVCTVIRAVNGLINQFDIIVRQQLEFQSAALNDNYYQAWSAFRYIAVGLLVLIGLAMVISQMIGIGIFDAYTVKKVLPRIFIAAILITLSWTLCKIVIDLVAVIGGATRGLIYAPFGGAVAIQDKLNAVIASNTGVTTGAFAGAAIGGAFLVATTNFLVILSLALPALLAVVLALILVILRQIVIVVMVIVSPLAVVAFILPGTDKAWKFWRENFFKALIMYPIIVAFLSIGKVFALVTLQGGTDTMHEIIALIAYFGPYFAIPATFKLAGGVLGTAHGLINNKSSGLLDKNRKFRQGQRAQTLADTRAGNRFKGNNRFSKTASGFMGYSSNLNRAGLNPMHMRRNMQAALAERDLAGMHENMEKNQAFKPFIGNDDLLAAATHGNMTEQDARAYLQSRGQTGRDLNQNLAHIAAAKRSMGERQFLMAAAVANAGTGTGYAGGPGEMLEAIGRASKGDMTLAGNMMAGAKSRAEGARRFDLSGAGFGDMYGQMQAISRAQSPADTKAAVQNATDFLTDKALDAQGPGAMLGGRGRSVENLIPAMQRRIARAQSAQYAAYNGGSAADQATADRNFRQALASTAGLLDVASQVSPENARMLSDGLLRVNVQDHAGKVQGTLGEHIAMNRDNSEFQEMRREYSQSTAEQYARAQATMGGAQGGPPTPIGPIGPVPK